MSIRKEIIDTEVRSSGFKKFQEDIMLVNKKINEYNDDLKRLNHQKDKLISAGKKESKEYRNTTKEITAVRKNIKQLKDALDAQEKSLSLTDMSYNQLKKRAAELTRQLYNMSEAADPQAFAKAREDLKKYQDQMAKMRQGIKMTNASFGQQKSSMWSNLKQLIPIASIVGIGNQLKNTAERAIETYTRLDDKMADVQKTTGMTKEEVKALDAELMKINTRTSREELLDLARVAGKLGVAKPDVEGFVRATDQIRVALSEDLGGDVEESIQKIGKLTGIFHLREELGLERSLLSVGSAINSLGAASEANEKYLVDFTNRTAGVAPQAKVSIQNVLGLGATLDQLGQSAEVAGTTYSQVMTGMYKKTDLYAKIAGMSVSEFSKLLREDANEAFLKFLEGANKTGDMEVMTKNLATLKLEGTRSTQVLGALAGNVNLIRQQQSLANVEFAKATSLTEEYNTKNASAQALMEKRHKAINEVVASLGEKLMPLWSETLGLMAGFISILKAVISTLIEYKGVILTVITVTTGYIAVKKLLNFYSKANRMAIAEEALAMRASITATANASLGAKALAAAKALVTFQFRSAAVAAKSFFISIGPIGWAITTATALVATLKGLKTVTAETAQVQKQLGVAIDTEVNKSLAEETGRLNSLRRQLIESEPHSKRRVELINQLRKEYPDLLKNINSEKETLDKVISSIDEYVKKSESRIRLHVIEQKYLNNLKELEDAKLKGETTGDKSEYFKVATRIRKENEILLEQLKYQQNLVAYSKEYADLVKERDELKPDISVDNLLPRIPISREDYEAEQQALANSTQRAEQVINLVSYDEYLKNFEKAVKEADSKTARFEAINARIREIETQKPTVINPTTDDAGNGDDKNKNGKWSLSSDESYLKAKAELREKQLNGEIATEEEYSRRLLALEIQTLENRIAANKEKGTDLAKLEEQLLDKRYQQQKAQIARKKELIAGSNETDGSETDSSKKMATETARYEQLLKAKGLFDKQWNDMDDVERAYVENQTRLHHNRLQSIFMESQSKKMTTAVKQFNREFDRLKIEHNNEIAALDTFEKKKQFLREKFGAAALQNVRTEKEADKKIKEYYQAEEQKYAKEHLEGLIAEYQKFLTEAKKELKDENGLSLGVGALNPEEIERVQAIIDDLNQKLAALRNSTPDTTGGKSHLGEVDILGFSAQDWIDTFGNLEKGKDAIDKWKMALQAVGEAFTAVSNLMSAAEQREFKNYEKTQNKKKKLLERQLKAGTISQERYNDAVQRIDEETDAKREEMELKQAKRQKLMAIFQAGVNTALAIMMTSAELGWPAAIPFVAAVSALGAAQIAAIIATPLPGAEEGGPIGVVREQDGKRFDAEFSPRKRGFVHRPTVIRTAGGQPVLTGEAGTEYVVPNDLLRMPEIAGMVNLIEATRLRGSFRPVNLSTAMAAGTIPGRESGGYVGRNPSTDAGSGNDASGTTATAYETELLRELRDTVGKLSRQLEKPLPVALSLYGRDGILTIQKKIEQQQRRAGIGGQAK
ncbi:MAG: phage tail tape measure protein [Rikenella sp.]|nr:phage tail tape measure protein [Rikenella sp.]